MSQNNSQCGPDAIDEFNDYTQSYSGTYSRSHYVRGTGVMERSNVYNRRNYRDSYTICSGITELADKCLSAQTIDSIKLPDTLVKINSQCFRYSIIQYIQLPESLEEIGNNNFPKTLEYIKLPANLRTFPTDNVQDCKKMTEISVDDDNKYFKSIDGVLYNYDVTEILICPRAKAGKVIIPHTVKRIADYCFDGCSKLTSIELPRSIEYIGNYAFGALSLDRLSIPNSVKTVGVGCFRSTTIRNKFRFSQIITSLPDECFQYANIPNTDFLKNIEDIGNYCFENKWYNVLPTYLCLPKIKKIGDYAFKDVGNIETLELPSSIREIGVGAFSGTADNLRLIFLSMAPFNLCQDAFSGIGDNAVLYVPKGSRHIFDISMPWRLFNYIEEYQPEEDLSNEHKAIGDDQLRSRLLQIASSLLNADRCYLTDLLQDLTMNYQNVDDDNDYEEAIEIIQYNRRFTPVLLPNLEKELCSGWLGKYRLKLVNSYIMNHGSALLSLPVQDEAHQIDVQPEGLTPLLIDGNIIEDINMTTPEIKDEVEVHFSDILLHLQNELSLAKQSVKVAVSWFTNYALFKQIKEMSQNKIDVQLIINNDSVNNGGYCLNFNELIEAGVHISLVEYPHLIHHKFCIIDDSVVINGSYNWTRFSENNYENIIIFRNNEDICDAFDIEFEDMLNKAEHKNVKAMPEIVPQRPEYDRNAFKQYITEELDAEARQTSDQRDKITALQKANALNSEYFERINPDAKKKYEEEFKVIEQSESIKQSVVQMVKENKTTSPANQRQNKKTTVKPKKSSDQVKLESIQDTSIIQEVKASNLLMVLDVSGSMKKTYQAGHVANITKKVVSAALTLSDSQTLSLWQFANDAKPIDEIDLGNISNINNVRCTGEGTHLEKFVSSANATIKENSLVIIFTDDDGKSIRDALSGMKGRKDVFWQIIVYGNHSEITEAIKDTPNVSLVSMTDYSSMSDEEITRALLRDYIIWKK